jgi:hypothetical protein
MNYLAHAYLSHGRSGILTGNIISDFVKGKKQFDLPSVVQKGIRLHRAIDTFTDQREETAFIKNMFRSRYRLYSGALADIVYDHFLANDTGIFNEEEAVQDLADATYEDLEKFKEILPSVFIPVFSGMKIHNWLVHYRHDWGIRRSFRGLEARAKNLGETDTAFDIFMQEKDKIREAYASFLPDIYAFSQQQLKGLLDSE